ncbi:MAG: porin family protein [Bacteroidia bacterium]
MKKLVFTLFAIACFSNTFAQSKIDAGIRISPIISTTSVFNSDGVKQGGYSSKLGFIASLMMNYNFTENFSVHTGLGYKMHGFTNSTLVKSKININSVEIPVALRLRTPEIGGNTGIHIRALAGTNIDIHTGGTVKIGDAVTKLQKLSPIGIGLLTSLGIDWTIEKVGMFDLGVRWNKGMTDTSTDKSIKQRIGYWGLDLGYYFNWGK